MSTLELASADLKAARLVVHKLGETFDSLQASFGGINNNLETRVNELEAKEIEFGVTAKKLRNFHQEVELKRQKLECWEKSLREEAEKVELGRNEGMKWLEIIEVRKREVSAQEKAVLVKETELAEGLERVRKVDDDEARVRKIELEVDERFKAVESRESRVEESFKAVELRENGIEERRKEFELRDKEIKKREEVIETRVEEGNRGMADKEKRLLKRCEELDLRERDLDETYSLLEARENEIYEEEKRVISKEEELKLREDRINSREGDIKVQFEELKAKEKDVFDRLDVLKAKERDIVDRFNTLKVKEEDFVDRFNTLKAKEEDFDGHVDVFKMKEKDIVGRSEVVKVKERDLGDQFIALKRKENEINERFASLRAREEEVDKPSRDVDHKNMEGNALRTGVEAKEATLNDHSEMLKLKGKEVDERSTRMVLKEEGVGELRLRLELKEKQMNEGRQDLETKQSQLNEGLQGLETKQNQLDEGLREMKVKEKGISERYKEMEMKEKQINRRKKALQLNEKQSEDSRKALELSEWQLEDSKSLSENLFESSRKGRLDLKESEVKLAEVAELQEEQTKEHFEVEESKENQCIVLSDSAELVEDQCIVLFDSAESKEKERIVLSDSTESKKKQCIGLSQSTESKEKQCIVLSNSTESKKKQCVGLSQLTEPKDKHLNVPYEELNFEQKQINEPSEVSGSRLKQITELSHCNEVSEMNVSLQAIELKMNQVNDATQRYETGQKQLHNHISTEIVDSLFCEMDGKSLQLYLNERVSKHDSMKAEVFELLKTNSNSGLLVLDAIGGFFAPDLRKNGVPFEVSVIRSSCLLLLEQLMNVKPLITNGIRRKAKRVARKWRRKMSMQGESEDLALALLLLLVTYELTFTVEKTDLSRLCGKVDQHKLAPRLRQALDLPEQTSVSSSIENAIKEPVQPASLQTANALKSSSVEFPNALKSSLDEGLKSYLIELVKKQNVLRDQILDALRWASHPAKLVLDVCQFYLIDCHNNKLAVFNNEAFEFLLEQLAKLCPSISDEVTNRAIKVASFLKAILKGNSNPVDNYRFLQFLAAYKLANSYTPDELLSHFKHFYSRVKVYRPEYACLCLALGIANEIPGVIIDLINRQKLVTAVRYICVFKLEQTFQPEALLEAEWASRKQKADQRRKGAKPTAKIEAADMESSALKTILACISDFNLESKLPPDRFLARMKELQKEKDLRMGVTLPKKRSPSPKPSAETVLHPEKRPRVGAMQQTQTVSPLYLHRPPIQQIQTVSHAYLPRPPPSFAHCFGLPNYVTPMINVPYRGFNPHGYGHVPPVAPCYYRPAASAGMYPSHAPPPFTK